MGHPFKQFLAPTGLIREFSKDVDSSELVWHRDHSDRLVTVMSGEGWQLQLENKLPVPLTPSETYFIPGHIYHRVLRGQTDLKIAIVENLSLPGGPPSSLPGIENSVSSPIDILIPPPPSIEVRLQELQAIAYQYHHRFNPPAMQDILDKDITLAFDSLLTSYGICGMAHEIRRLKNEIIPPIRLHKDHFGSPRPYELAEMFGIPFEYDVLETARTFSYPSGHTTQAYYVAIQLSRTFPQLFKELFTLAKMIAESRIDRGVHFPSDIAAGRLLAARLAGVNI